MRDYFERAYAIVLKKHWPHIPEEIRWQAANMLLNTLNGFVPYTWQRGLERGLLCPPSGEEAYWLGTLC